MLPAIAKRALAWVGKAATGFQYDAIDPRGRRRNPGSRVNREDAHAKGKKRNALQANAADLCRNLSLASWMVRRHLDYVSQFSFHSRIAHEGLSVEERDRLNDRIEKLMAEDNRPAKADVAGKFSREKLFRLAEMRRVLDGDTLLVKLDDGRLQGIQADLIEDPAETERKNGEEWINGVLVTAVGRPIKYAVKVRKGYTESTPDRRIDSTNAIHYGFFDRYAADQVRGFSPLVAALNPLRDVYENFDYALAKAKVSQLFAMAIFRDAIDRFDGTEDETTTAVDASGNEVEVTTGYKIDLGKGPMVLDLNDGDRAEFLESKTPSSEFQSFTQLIIQVALKALDIPFSN